MKRFVTLFLAVVMAFCTLPAFAANSLPEEVLLKVKAKIDVPEELTEFTYSENKYDDVIRYDFTWHTEDYTKELYVSTDSRGRIVTYNYYEQTDYTGDRRLIDYTLDDARPLAEETIEKMFPEYFAVKSNQLVLNEDKITTSYSGRYKSFSFVFERVNDDMSVESNRVLVRIRATKDKMYVQSVSAALDEDAKFIAFKNPAFDFLGKSREEYEKNFPIKLYYATDYSLDEPTVKLFYSIDKGYVDVATGKVVTEEYFKRYAGVTEDLAEDMEMGRGETLSKNEAMMSPKEQEEIERMESLVKPEDVENTLRDIAILKITEDMQYEESYAYKSEEKYFVRFTLKGEERRMNVTYNGETGEVVDIWTYRTTYDNEKDETESEFAVPKEDIKAFAALLSGRKIDETEVEFEQPDAYATMTATRIVNGVPYIENSINVTYNAKDEMVTHYSINWDEDTSNFPNPDDAMELDGAREIVFEDDINLVWLKQSEGYVGAITIPEDVVIDAITGEKPYKYGEEKKAYTDIENHWAKDAIKVLWEHDIYLAGDKFNPDEAINQADMIKLFSSCRDMGIIPLYWAKEEISRYGFENGYVEVNEPDKLMTRRESFDAMVEILGYGEIADFDIYKSSFTDMEACGSAEILKAMGVLTGDTARGKDLLSRAEAAVMVYRYLNR